MGSNEFLNALPLKMSANDVLMTARKSELRQRPRRMLARAAAAEVVAGQQDLYALAPRG